MCGVAMQMHRSLFNASAGRGGGGGGGGGHELVLLSLSLRSLLSCVSFFRLCSRYFVYLFFFRISSFFLFDGSVSFLFDFLALYLSQAFLYAILSL